MFWIFWEAPKARAGDPGDLKPIVLTNMVVMWYKPISYNKIRKILFTTVTPPIWSSSMRFTPHTLPLHSVFTAHNTHSHVGFTTITPHAGLFCEVHSTHITTTFCIYSTQHSLTCWFYNHHSPCRALLWGSLHTHYHYILYLQHTTFSLTCWFIQREENWKTQRKTLVAQETHQTKKPAHIIPCPKLGPELGPQR